MMKGSATNRDKSAATDTKESGFDLVAKPQPSGQKRSPPTKRDIYLKKIRGGVHPKDGDDYTPKYKVVIPKKNDEKAYGGLTDDSTYSEYAWQFLRRNRFYQRLMDRMVPTITDDKWEYAQADQEAPPIGLLTNKPYQEAFKSGIPVEWWGIHSFAKNLTYRQHFGPRGNFENPCEWPRSQVAIAFDLSGVLDNDFTAVDVQIEIAKKYLHSFASSLSLKTRRLRAPDSKHKRQLRAQLLIADLLSSPEAIVNMNAIRNDTPEETAKRRTRLEELRGMRLSANELLELLPDNYLFVGKPKRRESRQRPNQISPEKQRLKRISALAAAAWDNIYNRKYLEWLQFDDWSEIVPKAPTTQKPKTEQRELLARKRTVSKTATKWED